MLFHIFPIFLSFSLSLILILSRYKELEKEPKINEYEYTVGGLTNCGIPTLGGAALVSAISKFSSVSKSMDRIAAKYVRVLKGQKEREISKEEREEEQSERERERER